MKTNKIFLVALSTILMVFASCTKDFVEGFSSDPSETNTAGVNNLLTNAQQLTGWPQGDEIARITEVFVQRALGNARQGLAYQRYNITESNSNTDWRFNWYGGALKDLDVIIKTGEEQGANHYVGAAKVLMAINLGYLTDLFGDIPYTEAFQGQENLNPKYDTQESIYTAIQTLCDEAITSLNSTGLAGLNFGNFDQIYEGDTGKWVRLAHAVKARHLNHLSKLPQYDANAVVTEVGMALSSNADNAYVKYENVGVKGNPWAQFNVDRGDITYITGTAFETMLDSNSDPRKAEYAKMDNTTSGFFGNYDSHLVLYTYHEMKFIEAEARFSIGGGAAAQAPLEEAITANMQMLGVDASDITNYINALPTVTLEVIMNEKYRALYTQMESWTDWRRTGFPTLAVNPYSSNLDGINEIPRRLPYPQSERLYNSNFIDLSSSENRTQRMWWDQ